MESINQEVLNMMLTGIVIPLITLVSVYITTFIKKKTDELNIKIQESNLKIDSAQIEKYTTIAENAIIDAIMATNENYVNLLKNKNAFTKDAQIEAFEMTKDIALNIMNDATKSFMNEFVGDFNIWMETNITNLVQEVKN